ncbi:chromosome partitioning protein [Micromonospora sp. WMMD729]|uniref:chromosome partitioning protein n=1 Tax=Micromonospora sp. WMMD729 TaxID=3404127 RepID=UPI003BF50644
MDKNADRAQVPGQQPVPERDIEPLWPPDPAEQGAGEVVPPWAAVAERRVTPSQSSPPTVSPPVAAPPISAPSVGRPPVPGQPGAAALPPPSPSDYPSLTGAVPPPTGWGPNAPGGPGSGWAPAQPSWPPAEPPATSPAPPAPAAPPVPPTPPLPPAVGGLVGSHTAPSAAAPNPAATVASSGGANGATGTGSPGPAGTAPAAAGTTPGAATTPPGTAGATPGTAGATPGAGVTPGTGSAQESGAGPIPGTAGGVDLDLPFSLDRPPVVAAEGAASARPGTAGPAGADADTVGPTAVDPATAGSAAEPESPGGGETTPAVGAARPTAESPWAHPPQRPANPAPSNEQQASIPPPPIPAPPVPPTPAVDNGGAAGQPYAGQIYGGQPTIPGQAGPAPVEQPQDAVPTPPPGPFPPSPGWYPPPWQQGSAAVPPAPPQQYQETDPVARVPATGYPDATWTPETTAAPTAEDFARRRQVRPAEPVATMGVRAVVNKMGLLRLSPGRHEQELKRDIEMVRRNFGGLRQVTVVNPKGGAGKTVAILLLAMTFGQKRGGYVLAWDNNETQGTLGMRAQQDFHARTVRDMLRDLGQFQGAHGRVGDLSQYVRSQGEGMFDVLASDESATGGEMLTAAAFAEIREVVSRFYKLIFVDTGNNVRAQNWQASMDATDQLVVTMSARNDSAETAARMLDHLEQSGRQRLVRQAVTVVSMPPSRKEIDLPAIQEHFAARTRAVLLAPYERLIDSGEPIRYGGLSSATRDAWLKIAAAVAEGL